MIDSIVNFFDNLGEVEPENDKWMFVGGLAAGNLGGILLVPAMLMVDPATALTLSEFGAWVAVTVFLFSLITLPYQLNGMEVVRSSFAVASGLLIGICIPVYVVEVIREPPSPKTLGILAVVIIGVIFGVVDHQRDKKYLPENRQ